MMMSKSKCSAVVFEPGRRDPLDRRRADVDQPHVRLVVDLVVLGLERHPARAEAVVLRDQPLGRRRVLHPLADLARHEVGEQGVGLAVGEYVAEVALPHAEALRAVELLPLGLALLRRDLEGAARVGRVQEAGEGLLAALQDVRVLLADLRHLLLGDRPVVQRRRPVGRALEDRQRPRRLRHLLDGLHAGRAGADHGDPLAREVDRLLGEARGVAGQALEEVDARDLGQGRGGERADRGDQEARAVACCRPPA